MNEEELKKDVAHVIKVFIEKHYANSSKVEWREWEFKVKEIISVEIDAKSLNRYGERWTFEGAVDIIKVDKRGTASPKTRCQIIGSAKVTFYPNSYNPKELLPEIENVSITKIEEI